MTNRLNIFKFILLAFMLSLSACAVKTEQVRLPYLQEKAEEFMQAGIENYERYYYAAALNQFANAREIYARYDDAIGIVNAELNLCRVQMAVGQYDAVLQRLDKLAVLIEQNQRQQQIIYRDIILSSVYLLNNDLDSAGNVLRVYDEQLMNNTIEDKSLMAGLLINRVRLADASNEGFETWLSQFEHFVATHNKSTDYTLRLYRFKAKQLRNDASESNHYYTQALEGYRQMADPVGVMSTLLEWADAHFSRDEVLQAKQKYQRALETGLVNYNRRIVEQSLHGLNKMSSGATQERKVINDWLLLLKNEDGLDVLIQQYDDKLLN